MKLAGGVWLPDHEQHLIDWMEHPKNRTLIDGKITYQWGKQMAAMALVRRFGVAVDVGAHCGLWSMHLVKRFAQVHAFEPVAEHRACFEKNVQADNARLYPYALGEAEGSCAIETPQGSSGGSFVVKGGEIPVKRLDGFDLPEVDFLKIDCEGYELFVLRGAEEMLKRCRPAIIVEQKPNRPDRYGLKQTEAVQYLEKLGARLRQIYSGDYLMSWDEA